jgi:hypothetical protein
MAGHHEDKVALIWIMNNVRDVLHNYAICVQILLWGVHHLIMEVVPIKLYKS